MIKVYTMESCPDCQAIKQDVLKRSDEFELIDIAEHVKKLKEFIRIRDNSPLFDEIKANGGLGIPCFVEENGDISFEPEKYGIIKEEIETQSCSLDKKGNC